MYITICSECVRSKVTSTKQSLNCKSGCKLASRSLQSLLESRCQSFRRLKLIPVTCNCYSQKLQLSYCIASSVFCVCTTQSVRSILDCSSLQNLSRLSLSSLVQLYSHYQYNLLSCRQSITTVTMCVTRMDFTKVYIQNAEIYN